MERLRKAPLVITAIFLVYMPFHVFLAQWLSTLTGGLDAWKITKDIVLFVALLLTTGLVLLTKAYRGRKYLLFLALTLAYGLLHLLLWKTHTGIDQESAALGTVYNGRLPGFVLLGWGAALVYPGKVNIRWFAKLIIAVSTIVCLLAIIQYNLPKDFMTHFGYSTDRGVLPAFFIDSKPDLPRVMSTLRDPNSLGAFLLLPLTLLVGAWFRRAKDKLLIAGLILLHALVLFLTFSRGAWIGAFVSVGLFLLWNFRELFRRTIKRYWPMIIAGVVVFCGVLFLLRDQYVVQNVIFHADENTTMASSNDLHVELAKKGLEGIVDQPFGHGPGTAGLVAIHTTGFLTENYFIQIGYEVGIIGLLLFLALLVLLVHILWKSRSSMIVSATLASLAGLVAMNMLFHTWSNEAVAAEWWLMAGLLAGAGLNSGRIPKKEKR